MFINANTGGPLLIGHFKTERPILMTGLNLNLLQIWKFADFSEIHLISRRAK